MLVLLVQNHALSCCNAQTRNSPVKPTILFPPSRQRQRATQSDVSGDPVDLGDPDYTPDDTPLQGKISARVPEPHPEAPAGEKRPARRGARGAAAPPVVESDPSLPPELQHTANRGGKHKSSAVQTTSRGGGRQTGAGAAARRVEVGRGGGGEGVKTRSGAGVGSACTCGQVSARVDG